jgi:poly(3-hydroxybutyrate) depolymerase
MRRHTTGSVPAWALARDQRFSYYSYVPTGSPADEPPAVVVLIHGVTRKAQSYRDRFAGWAQANNCVIIAPLFPCGLVRPDDMDNYKDVLYQGIRFDLVLLDIVEEVRRRHQLEPGRFLLHGFSSGGQFVQRFLLIHPATLGAVSIAAPSATASIAARAAWPEGLDDLEDLFGTTFEPSSVAQVPVQTLIGGADTGAYDPRTGDQISHPQPGLTRPEVLDRVVVELRSLGARVEHTVIPDVGHESGAMAPEVQAFFGRLIEASRIG